MNSENKTIRLKLIGDSNIGKHVLTLLFTLGTIPDGNEHHCENYETTVKIDNQIIQLKINVYKARDEVNYIWEPQYYNDTDIFLLCFSIDNLRSFQNIFNKWYPEIHHYEPSIPFILVGLKSDQRHSIIKKEIVSIEEAQQKAKEIQALHYIECSTLWNENVASVFEIAIKTALKKSNEKEKMKKGCCIC